jgi:glycosyltransferase involved in cell wall biosynthesis
MTRPVLAYLVNQYPKVSHSFIRREILALEQMGFKVHRWASRGWDASCPDEADQREQLQTRYLLNRGPASLFTALLRTAATRPVRFASTLRSVWQCSRGSERPVGVHLAYLAQACVALQWARESSVAHVHAHFGTNPAEVAMLLAALGGPSYSFTVHGPEEFDQPRALHLGAKARCAAFVVAISSFGRSQLYRWADAVDWPRIAVIHCGLDRSYTQREPSAAPDVSRLVCVGRLCEQKGQLLLVRATARLVACGVPIELVLAGDGELRADIEDECARLGVAEHVRITGWIDGDQVRDELAAARALVLPSFAEGLPVVLMEALASGRPVITTFIAGIPELVLDGENGWLIPAGDVDGLVAAMQECLSTSSDRLSAMGRAGRQRVLARHDIDIEAAKLGELFVRAASGRAVGA